MKFNFKERSTKSTERVSNVSSDAKTLINIEYKKQIMLLKFQQAQNL